MARLMGVVVVVGLLVWALAFVDFGRPRARSKGVEPAPADLPAAAASPQLSAPKPVIAAKPAATTPLELQRVPPDSPKIDTATLDPRSAALVRAGLMRRPPGATTAPAERLTRASQRGGALSTATGELGEGIMSPEYAEMERAYAHEPRDGAWADGEEQRIRSLFAKTPFEDQVALVNCQETLCRVLLETDDFQAFEHLLGVRGFRELSGLDASSPYSFRSGQLSVYFSRRGAHGTL